MSAPPRISIVIPCFQAARHLERALRSLAGQDHDNLEIFVMDAGSNDGTREILERWSPRLAGWVSEPDRGQAHAINKGFARATGEILGWLCADDELAPGALRAVAAAFARHPEAGWIAGACEMQYENGAGRDFLFRPRPDFDRLLPAFNGVMQPSVFFRRGAQDREPVLDESYHYALDAELWCRLKSRGVPVVVLPDTLSRFNQDGTNKTASGGKKIGLELDRLYRAYSRDRVPLSWWYRTFRYPLELTIRRDRGPLRRLVLGGFQALWILLLAPFYGWARVRHMSWPA